MGTQQDANSQHRADQEDHDERPDEFHGRECSDATKGLKGELRGRHPFSLDPPGRAISDPDADSVGTRVVADQGSRGDFVAPPGMAEPARQAREASPSGGQSRQGLRHPLGLPAGVRRVPSSPSPDLIRGPQKCSKKAQEPFLFAQTPISRPTMNLLILLLSLVFNPPSASATAPVDGLGSSDQGIPLSLDDASVDSDGGRRLADRRYGR